MGQAVEEHRIRVGSIMFTGQIKLTHGLLGDVRKVLRTPHCNLSELQT